MSSSDDDQQQNQAAAAAEASAAPATTTTDTSGIHRNMHKERKKKKKNADELPRFCVMYAKTHRICMMSRCKEDIQPGALRAGYRVTVGPNSTMHYVHLCCAKPKLFLNEENETITNVEDIPGYEYIKEEHRPLIQTMLENKLFKFHGKMNMLLPDDQMRVLRGEEVENKPPKINLKTKYGKDKAAKKQAKLSRLERKKKRKAAKSQKKGKAKKKAKKEAKKAKGKVGVAVKKKKGLDPEKQAKKLAKRAEVKARKAERRAKKATQPTKKAKKAGGKKAAPSAGAFGKI